MKRLVLFLLTCKELMQLFFLREGQCWAGRGAKVKGEGKEGPGANSKEQWKFTSVAFFLMGLSAAGYVNFNQTNMSQEV